MASVPPPAVPAKVAAPLQPGERVVDSSSIGQHRGVQAQTGRLAQDLTGQCLDCRRAYRFARVKTAIDAILPGVSIGPVMASPLTGGRRAFGDEPRPLRCSSQSES